MIPRRYLLMGATFLLALLLYVDRICISTAKGPVSGALGLSDKEFGWVLSAFALGYALFQTPSGMLADRYGPRAVLASIVALWSLFTGLTAFAWNLASMLVIRFLFGMGEAGAFPGMARAFYAWIPMQERGIAQGINFSGGRLGAAFALPGIAYLIDRFGWKQTFCLLMGVGFVWALAWFAWFRDDPTAHSGVSAEERCRILASRQSPAPRSVRLSFARLMSSGNLWLAMGQYFCSNFTFFFCLTWLFPHLKQTYNLEAVEAGFYSSAPLLGGAVGNVVSGWLIDRIYRAGRWKHSRQIPAIAGFALAAVGLLASLGQATAFGAVFWLTVAIFGADMTLAPSWAFCIDIGQSNAGAVSGTMNMAGNIGSFVTSLAFPYLLDWTGNTNIFFVVAAVLNAVAIALWLFVRPQQPIVEFPHDP